MSHLQEQQWKQVLKSAEDCARSGDYAGAESLYRQALTMAEEGGDRQDGELVTALMHLGDFYLSRKQFSQAQPVYERALTIYENCHGEENVLSILCMRRLCDVYRSQGKLEQARKLNERVERIGYVD